MEEQVGEEAMPCCGRIAVLSLGKEGTTYQVTLCCGCHTGSFVEPALFAFCSSGAAFRSQPDPGSISSNFSKGIFTHRRVGALSA